MKLSLSLPNQLQGRLSALSSRERLYMIIGAGALVFFAVNSLFFQKQKAQIATVNAQLQASEVSLNRLLADIKAIENGTFPQEAGAALVAELSELQKKNQTLDVLLRSVKGRTPQIGGLIRSLIRTQHQKVSLESIRTIAPQLLLSQQPPAGSNIYRHGLEVSLKGGYLDLLSYIRSLESSVGGLFWSGLALSSDGKEATITMTIFILSNEAEPILA